MASILVFSPHFDDESISCGGAIARCVAEGGRAVVAFMTRGDTGNITPGCEMTPEQGERLRKDEANKALAILGVNAVEYVDETDGFMRWTEQTVRKVAAVIRKTRPDIIYVPHEADAHNDHIATYRIVHDAIPRAAWSAFPELGEPWFTPEIRCYEGWTPIQKPNLYIDISAYVDIKRAAISVYESQNAKDTYAEAALGLNRYRGITGFGCPYAEAYIRQRIDKI